MKTAYAYASIALALMNAEGILAYTHHHHHSTSALTTSASTTVSAYPSASASPNSTTNSTSPGSPITAGSCSNCDGVCVTFGATSGDLWYWFNGGPGGDPSQFGTKPIGPVCLTDAGAMFVASSSMNTNGGSNTKFEWSVGSDTSNFDVSVCDGFSVPMVCTGFNGNQTSTDTIGGGEICSDCPNPNSGGNCPNPGAHTGDVTKVPSCFLAGEGPKGTESTNNYWYYDNISVQAIFTDRKDIVCTVGSIGSKEKRDMGQSAIKHRHAHQRRAAQGHGLHAVS